MMANAGPPSIFSRIGLLVMALLMAAITSADCLRDPRGEVYCGAGRCIIDSRGTVWCSRHYDGDAQITYHPHSGGYEVAPPGGAKNNAANSGNSYNTLSLG